MVRIEFKLTESQALCLKDSLDQRRINNLEERSFAERQVDDALAILRGALKEGLT